MKTLCDDCREHLSKRRGKPLLRAEYGEATKKEPCYVCYSNGEDQ